MFELLKQTNRGENVVGWYYSHPSFGYWLSSFDINTHVTVAIMPAILRTCVGVVVDPIQSVQAKVFIYLCVPAINSMKCLLQRSWLSCGQSLTTNVLDQIHFTQTMLPNSQFSSNYKLMSIQRLVANN